jgi:ubiquinone/menaquinone biosynthesis C-methylase UbiE
MPGDSATGYHVLPRFYDRWQDTYGRDFTAVILPRLLASIRQFKIPVSTFLDVGCGTGTLALSMARRGWHAWGVDASEEMVSVAERKRKDAGLTATFIRQDMRELHLPRRVRLVTSMFDTLNHVLSSDELFATLVRIHSVLQSGGYFMFDLNNEHCYRTLWNQDEEIRHRDFTLVLENSFDAASGKARSMVTLTPRAGEPMTEVVVEQLFSSEEVHGFLEQAGFQVCMSEEFKFPDVPEAGPLKTWWVAKKQKQEDRGKRQER